MQSDKHPFQRRNQIVMAATRLVNGLGGLSVTGNQGRIFQLPSQGRKGLLDRVLDSLLNHLLPPFSTSDRRISAPTSEPR